MNNIFSVEKNTYLILLIIFSLVFAVHGQYSSVNHLIEAKDLNNILDDNSISIIDIRKSEEYNKGHLNGALNIWRPDIQDFENEFQGMMAPKEKLEKLFSSLGIPPNNRIIIYDAKGEVDAARLWWVLYTYGYKNVELLNGGITNWQKQGYKLTQKIPEIQPTEFKFRDQENYNLYASLNDVRNAINAPNSIILDTRTTKEYTGETLKKPAIRAGRIPGSINIDFAASCNWNSDKKFKKIDELKDLFAAKGVTSEKNIIAYCASGVRSAHTTFVLTQLLGYKNVRNFDGSWIQWSQIKELPIESGFELANVETSKKDINQMEKYLQIISDSYTGYANYIINEIALKNGTLYGNYFYGLIIISILFFVLEQIKPWRENQPRFRKDFWLDFFYMFFNFFLFGLIIFAGLSNVGVNIFNDFLGLFGITNIVAIEVNNLPKWSQLLILFVVKDFIEWWVHRMLHYFDFLWEFHKVHHSVEQMGFAAHLRYHWMENVIYKSVEYIPLAMIGFGIQDFFYVHIFAIAIGHWNHANWKINIGLLGYILNNPNMHMWHHAYEIPEDRKYGINFGLTLSIWDYIFGTAYIPHSGKDIKLGFPGVEEFPQSFIKQSLYGFLNTSTKDKPRVKGE